MPPKPGPRDDLPFPEAWARHEAAIRAVELPAGPPPNVDVIFLGAQVERVARRLVPYRARLLDELTHFDPRWIDELPSLARATMWTGMEVRTVARPTASALPLIVESKTLRRRLELALRTRLALAPHPGARRVPTLDGRSAVHYGMQLQALAIALRAEDAGCTLLTAEELAAAEELALRLLQAGSPSIEGEAELAEARTLRAKALFLLRTTYDEARAAVLYVARHERGIADVVPSLWSVRGPKVGNNGRKRMAAAEKRKGDVAGDVSTTPDTATAGLGE